MSTSCEVRYVKKTGDDVVCWIDAENPSLVHERVRASLALQDSTASALREPFVVWLCKAAQTFSAVTI